MDEKIIPIKQGARDLIARYDRTLVRYKGVVYYCRVRSPEPEYFIDEEGHEVFEPSSREDTEFELSKVSNPGINPIVVNPYDGVDSKSIRLGYVNTPNGAIYTFREPRRRWKQTVCAEDLSNFLGRYMYTQATEDMLNNRYPSLQDAINIISNPDNGISSVAFSKYIKIHRNRKNGRQLTVFFKEVEVGKIPDFYNDVTILFADRRITWAMSPYLKDVQWRVENDN